MRTSTAPEIPIMMTAVEAAHAAIAARAKAAAEAEALFQVTHAAAIAYHAHSACYDVRTERALAMAAEAEAVARTELAAAARIDATTTAEAEANARDRADRPRYYDGKRDGRGGLDPSGTSSEYSGGYIQGRGDRAVRKLNDLPTNEKWCKE